MFDTPPEIRSRCFPAMDNLAEELIGTGMNAFEVYGIFAAYAAERLLEELPNQFGPDQTTAMMANLQRGAK